MTTTRPAEPTIDEPATVESKAEYYVDRDGGLPGLVVTFDLPNPPGADWVFDSVLSIDPEDRTISVLCYPDVEDDGWERLNDVGEW